MDESTIQRVQQSYGRCSLQAGFWDRFYDLLLASSPAIASVFANTDLEKQKGIIKGSLNYIIMYAKDNNAAFAKNKLEHVGELHDHNHFKVTPDMYKFWVDSLIQTLGEFDNQFDDTLRQDWILVITPSIDLLKSKY